MFTWYGDNSNFVDSSNPWFNRGGNYNNGVLAGQFNFNRNTGGVNTNIGFRLVLGTKIYKYYFIKTWIKTNSSIVYQLSKDFVLMFILEIYDLSTM